MKRLALALTCAACAILASCTEEKPKEEVKAPPPVKQAVKVDEPPPPVPEAPALPEPVTKMKDALIAAGMNVPSVVVLKGHTMPGCNEDYRYRLYLGDPKAANVEFVNVAHFATDADATACLEFYKAAVLKAGQAAWDRLGPMVSTNKNWLNFFAEAMTDVARREAVLAELKKIQ